MFLPPNVTCLIQPMDQNTIRITKLFYRKNLLSVMTNNPENVMEGMKDITLRDVVRNVSAAWHQLSLSAITMCWRNLLGGGDNLEDEDLLPLNVITKQILQERIVQYGGD